jgi:putative oxidoreductase
MKDLLVTEESLAPAQPMRRSKRRDAMTTTWITTMKVLSDFTLKLSTRFPMARWSPIPLRLIVGYGFMEHGFAKLSKGPDAFAAILQGMGVPDPYLMAWFTILIELLGGLAVILGAFVTIVSVPMAVVLLVAMFKVHLPYGFSSIKLIAVTTTGAKFGPPGYEVNLLYIACLAALVIGGSGPFAIDGLIGKRVRGGPGARLGPGGRPYRDASACGRRGRHQLRLSTGRLPARGFTGVPLASALRL